MFRNIFLLSFIFELLVALSSVFFLKEYVLAANAFGYSFFSIVLYLRNNQELNKLGAVVLALFNFCAAMAQIINLINNPGINQLVGAIIVHLLMTLLFVAYRLKIKG